jgi:hypothetical protein
VQTANSPYGMLNIPVNVRRIGYAPDISQWLPGDLVLVSQPAPGLIARAITQTQRSMGFADEHAQWQHAAMYVGKDKVCEATRGGVKAVSLFKYVKDAHLIRLRRDPALTDAQRLQMVVEALQMLPYQYSRSSILALVWRNWRSRMGWSNGPPVLTPGATICSQMYNDAFGLAHGRPAVFTPHWTVTPADLSRTDNLQDVPDLRWVQI